MNSVTIKKIQSCRICKSEKLEMVLNLNKMPFTDEFVSQENIGTEFLSDIEIGICNNCGSVQNLNDTDMSMYYNEYTYSVQSSSFAMNFMKLLANRIKQSYFENNESPKILEIGSGSGEQLLEFKKLGFNVLGIEPSQKLSDYANTIGVKTITAFFDENTRKIVNSDFTQVDVVISSYTFDHIPRPVEVLENIYNILTDNGLVVLEVHDLDLISERNEFCLFEHEHYTYLNESTLKNLLSITGFEVLDFNILENNEKRANSLLVVARKNISYKKIIDVDAKMEISKIKKLSNNIYNSILNLEVWLNDNSGKKVVAYGAGGRGIMTIAAINNSELFKFIVDKNPKSINIFAPKSNLPVYSVNQLGVDKADIIVVFSFGYFSEIVEEVSLKYGYNKNQFISIIDILKSSKIY